MFAKNGVGFLILCTLLFSSCEDNRKEAKQQPDKPALFELLSKETTGINFVNAIENQPAFNILTFRNYYNGAGVGIGDINNDGLNDVYFTSNMGSNKLYLNKGNLQFEDVTEKAGVGGTKYWSTGVSMADVNADGYLDIYVCNSGDLANKNRDN